MKKWLAPMFAVALASLGCDDEETVIRYDGGGGATDGGGGTAGTGGTGGMGGTAGIDAAAGMGGTGGTAGTDGGMTIGDGSVDASSTTDAMTSATWATDPAQCQMNSGIAATEFCSYLETKCGYGSNAGQVMNMGLCVSRYNSYNTTQKGCAVYHLCVAGTSPTAGQTHCPHPIGAPGNNPCALP